MSVTPFPGRADWPNRSLRPDSGPPKSAFRRAGQDRLSGHRRVVAASQADRAPAQRTAPTRIWWVVNRRLLVDSTAEHAERIANAFSDPDSANISWRDREVVARVAQRLTSLSAEPGGSPLEVIRLRGGVASRTPTDPSRPAVLLCTLPMYGSRLLFRGYGSNQRLRVVDAAMAGTDSLVLLDEAHLAPHLKALLPALAGCTPSAHAGTVKLTKSSSIDPQDTGLEPAVNPPCWGIRNGRQPQLDNTPVGADGMVARGLPARPGFGVILLPPSACNAGTGCPPDRNQYRDTAGTSAPDRPG